MTEAEKDAAADQTVVDAGAFVLPGDLVDTTGARAGTGTYRLHGSTYAATVGYKIARGETVYVQPTSGTYIPRVGDQVVGTITGIGPSNWFINYDAAFDAPLNVNDVPWRVEFGDG